MNELALFAGVGGGVLGSKYMLGARTVCYVEWEPYCVEVLKARIRDGYLDDAPIWDDVNTFDGTPWAGSVDLITAGFPCQPFSTAGKGLGELDPRNGWPATIRIIREVRPRIALLENVSALLSKPYARRIFGDLAESGYDARWCCVAAADAGAPHIRDRVWIMAYASCEPGGVRLQPRQEGDETGRGSEILHTSGQDVEERRGNQSIREPAKTGWWDVEPGVGRVVDGMAHRVDRLKAIGNGQVPAVVGLFWEIMNR
jgi:DNA (cytosine-5)-methyltransferase 1